MRISHSILVSLILFMSCTEEFEKIISPEKNMSLSSDYVMPSEFRYWVYEETVTSPTQETTISKDTVFYVGEEEINGNVYKVFNGKLPGTNRSLIQYFRDSSNFIVNRHGSVILTTTLLNTAVDEIDNPYYSISTRFFEEDQLQLGEQQFKEIINRKETVVINYQSANETFVNDNQYAKGIGLIRQTQFAWSSNTRIERRLIKWK